METMNGSTHPATLMKKCSVCNFILKNQFNLALDDDPPYWYLFCPNLSCVKFGLPQIRYKFFKADAPMTVDSKLFSDAKPDTSLESD